MQQGDVAAGFLNLRTRRSSDVASSKLLMDNTSSSTEEWFLSWMQVEEEAEEQVVKNLRNIVIMHSY
jgi:hypothetical protein